MTQNSDKMENVPHDVSDVPDVTSVAELGDVADPELEQLLCDAYDVPAVPRSLLKRLDQAVEQEWGVSPNVSQQERGWFTLAAGRTVRSLKSWTVAGCVVAAVAVAVMFNPDSRAYGWTAMLEALSRQPVVQIAADDESEVRWMSIANGMVNQRSGGTSRLSDFHNGVVLKRVQSESRTTRSQFASASGESARDQMVFAFLLGDAATEFGPLKVIDENWSKSRDAGRDVIALNVTLGESIANGRRVQLNVTLDPETRLPITYQLAGNNRSAQKLKFSYPDTEVSTLVARDYPGGAAAGEIDVVAVAPTDTIRLPKNGTDGTGSGKPDEAVTHVEINPVKPEKPVAVPIVGAATLDWKPVAAPNLSHDEFLKRINAALVRLWRENEVEPTVPATDEELLRRVYLDLVGRTPSVFEVRSYLEMTAADRYETLVDRLLASRDHSTHLATVWRTFLLPEGVDLSRFGGTEAFDEWLSGQFGKNEPYDEVVRRLLVAEGRLSKSGPLLLYASTKLDADQLASRTARVFLGMRLECAQCHDDPFEPWTQEDFWSYAAFFARISRPQAALESVSTLMRVSDVDRGDVMLPDTDRIVAPRFLDGSQIDTSSKAAPRRHQLAHWLASGKNPYFARAAVNRVWGHLLGGGIVDPIDGFGETHPPKSTELLDLLAGHFVESGFDLRALFRSVALSRAYRLSSGSKDPDLERLACFAQMNVKTLTAEQIYDCIVVASMLTKSDNGGDGNGFNLERTGNTNREEFLQLFRTPVGKSTEYHGGIPQALTLMNGILISNATGLAESGLLKSLEAPFFKDDDQRVEVLYLATMSRKPTPTEWEILRPYVKDRVPGTSIQEPLADILWALLNSAEFTMNH